MSFTEYVANRTFSIGQGQEGQVEIEQGKLVKFDGQTLIHRGEEYNLPKVSRAIDEGWLEEDSDGQKQARQTRQQGEPRPQSAEIEMTAATPQDEDKVMRGDAEVVEEERVVSSVDQRPQPESTAGPNMQQEQQRTKQADRTTPQRTQSAQVDQTESVSAETNVGTEQSGRGENVVSAAAGQTVASGFQTPTEQKETKVSAGTRNSTQQEIQKARGAVREKRDEFKPSGESGQAPSKDTRKMTDEEARQHREQQPQQTQAQDQTQERPEKRVETSPEDTTKQEPELSIERREDRYELIRSVVQSLPDWDFDEHWKRKQKKLEEDETYQDDMIIRAIHASESTAMKSRIRRKYPEAFMPDQTEDEDDE